MGQQTNKISFFRTVESDEDSNDVEVYKKDDNKSYILNSISK
jgi:hypothetical protein